MDSSPSHFAVSLLLVMSSVAYLFLIFRTLTTLRALKRLDEVPAIPLHVWPKVSVIVPACNEGHTLGAAIRSLLAEGYPHLEVVLINDRSTDDTGKIADELALSDSRVRVIHLASLPEGWLGKVHALHVGSQQATGDWLLLTDADVHFAQGTIQKAIAVAEAEKLQHLAMLPHLISHAFLLEVAIDASGMAFFFSARPHLVEDAQSDAFMGVGAFNLVKAQALRAAGGFEWLGLEIADDVGVGLMLKRFQAKSRMLLAPRQVAVEWYPTLKAMVRGLEKNLFAVMCNFSLVRALRVATILLALGLGPLLSVLCAPWVSPWVSMLGLLALVSTGISALALKRRFDQNVLPALFAPLGFLILCAMVLRSTWVTLRQGGIEWRGTKYPLASLKAHQRVKL